MRRLERLVRLLLLCCSSRWHLNCARVVARSARSEITSLPENLDDHAPRRRCLGQKRDKTTTKPASVAPASPPSVQTMTPRTKAPSLQPQTSGMEVPTRLSIPSSAETPTTRNEDTTNDDALWITLLNFAVTLQGTVSSTEVMIQALTAYLETTLSAQKVTLKEVSPAKIQEANSTEYEFSVTAWFTQGSVNEGLILEQQRAAFRDVAPVQAFLQVYFNASGSNGVTISSIEVMEEEEASNSRKTVLVIAIIVAASAWCCVLVFVCWVVDRVVVGLWIVRWYWLFQWGCLEMSRRPLVVVVLILVVQYMSLRWSRSCPTIRRRIGFVRECGARLL